MTKKILKIITIILTIIIIFANISTVYADDVDTEEDEDLIEEISKEEIEEVANNLENEPTLNSRRCIVYDRTSKTILYGKNETTKSAMASTTKIMTATIVLENANLQDTVEISAKAGGTGGSRLGLKKRGQNNSRRLIIWANVKVRK